MNVRRTSFSPGALAHAADPYALLAAVRAEGEVLRSDGSWIVLGHAEAETLLRHPAARSGFAGEIYRRILPPGGARDEMGHRINFLDAPDHARVRSLVAKAFTPRRVNALRPFVTSLCDALLAKLSGLAEADLLPAYAHPVPSLVISELLGVPVADRDHLTSLSERVSHLLGLSALDAERRGDAIVAAEEMHTYLRALLAERKREPADDLLSALHAAEEGEQRLSDAEMLSLAATLYSAGHRTTRDLFSNGLAALLAAPALRDDVAQGRIPRAAAVEEFLRFETPTHYVARMLAEPVALGGVRIPAGEPIVVMLAAANRDPRAYDEPDRFDPRRFTAGAPPPLSFAFGPHFCLGASLARLEADVMLERLLAAFPRVSLGAAPLRWRHTGLFRGLHALPVALS